MSIFEELKQQYRMGGVTEKLIYLNVLLFAVPYVVQGILSLFQIPFPFLSYISLSSNSADLLWKPWSLLTYAFFHAGFFHILFNLIVFHFASRLFLTFFTQKQLLSMFLTGALFSGIIYLISYFIFPALINQNAQLVGASGAIMAVLFAVTTYAPHMQIRLLLIGTVKLWHIALFYLIVDLISLSFDNVGGHIAHLGGALFGYLYSTQLKKGTDITKPFTALMDGISNGFKGRKSKPFKKVHKNEAFVKPKPVTKDKTQQQIDEILDKISKSGYDSLTQDEKEFLFKVSKN